MLDKKNGVVALMKKHFEQDSLNQNLIQLHCVIHQEALCAKYVSMNVKRVDVKTELHFGTRFDSQAISTITA